MLLLCGRMCCCLIAPPQNQYNSSTPHCNMLLTLVFAAVVVVTGVWHCPDGKIADDPWSNNKPQCGWTLETPSLLTYPGAGNSKAEEDCKWIITAPKDKRVKVEFLLLETSNELDSCLENYIEISIKTGVVNKYCKNVKPGLVLTVQDNIMMLKFRSKNKGSRFSIRFSAVPDKATSCGANARTGDLIKLPIAVKKNEVKEYDCTWYVTAPEGKVVEARFSGAEIGPAPSLETHVCEKDYLKVSPISGRTHTFCGSYSYAFGTSPLYRLISSGQTMKIDLKYTHFYNYYKNWELLVELIAIDPGSVAVQYFTSMFVFDFDLKAYNRERLGYVSVRHEDQRISLLHGATAQMVYQPGTGPVTITITADGGGRAGVTYRNVTFQTDPHIFWVVKFDGIYRQDGSTDPTKTTSSIPEHRWDCSHCGRD